jgi:Flp pilus assembly protein TadD
MRSPILLDCCLLLLAASVAVPACSVDAIARPAKPVAVPPLDGSEANVSVDGRSTKSRGLYLALIREMRQSGKTYAALAHLDAFEKMYPHVAEAVVLRGDCLVDIGSYAEAQAVYRTLLKSKTTAAPANAGLGRIEGLNGRWAEAAGDFSQAVTLDPTNPSYLSDLGYALMRQGSLDQALFRIKQASQLAPSDARVRNNLILVLAASGDSAGSKLLLDGIADGAERADLQAAIVAQAAQRQAPPAAAVPPAG